METNEVVNERVVILLIFAHLLIFVSMVTINVILGVINDLLENLIRFMKNINELIHTFGEIGN